MILNQPGLSWTGKIRNWGRHSYSCKVTLVLALWQMQAAEITWLYKHTTSHCSPSLVLRTVSVSLCFQQILLKMMEFKLNLILSLTHCRETQQQTTELSDDIPSLEEPHMADFKVTSGWGQRDLDLQMMMQFVSNGWLNSVKSYGIR